MSHVTTTLLKLTVVAEAGGTTVSDGGGGGRESGKALFAGCRRRPARTVRRKSNKLRSS